MQCTIPFDTNSFGTILRLLIENLILSVHVQIKTFHCNYIWEPSVMLCSKYLFNEKVIFTNSHQIPNYFQN